MKNTGLAVAMRVVLAILTTPAHAKSDDMQHALIVVAASVAVAATRCPNIKRGVTLNVIMQLMLADAKNTPDELI